MILLFLLACVLCAGVWRLLVCLSAYQAQLFNLFQLLGTRYCGPVLCTWSLETGRLGEERRFAGEWRVESGDEVGNCAFPSFVVGRDVGRFFCHYAMRREVSCEQCAIGK